MPLKSKGRKLELWGEPVGAPDLEREKPRRGFECLNLGTDNPLYYKDSNSSVAGTCSIVDSDDEEGEELHVAHQVFRKPYDHAQTHLKYRKTCKEERAKGKIVTTFKGTVNPNSLQLLAKQLNVELTGPGGTALADRLGTTIACCFENKDGEMCGHITQHTTTAATLRVFKNHLQTHQKHLAMKESNVFFCSLCWAWPGTNSRKELDNHLQRHGSEGKKAYKSVNEGSADVWALYLSRKFLFEATEARDWAGKFYDDLYYDYDDDWKIPANGVFLPHFPHA